MNGFTLDLKSRSDERGDVDRSLQWAGYSLHRIAAADTLA
jgi:hypothetical protein